MATIYKYKTLSFLTIGEKKISFSIPCDGRDNGFLPCIVLDPKRFQEIKDLETRINNKEMQVTVFGELQNRTYNQRTSASLIVDHFRFTEKQDFGNNKQITDYTRKNDSPIKICDVCRNTHSGSTGTCNECATNELLNSIGD